MCLTNKYFNRIHNEEYFWKLKFDLDFPNDPKKENYKNWYIRNYFIIGGINKYQLERYHIPTNLPSMPINMSIPNVTRLPKSMSISYIIHDKIKDIDPIFRSILAYNKFK